MTKTVHLTYGDIEAEARLVARRWAHLDCSGVFGVPRGGAIPAALVATRLNVPLLDEPGDKDSLVVDDLVDSGATLQAYADRGLLVDALFRKRRAGNLAVSAHEFTDDTWLVFPWERDTDDAHGPADAVTRLLEYIGEDPTRPGLKDTPRRVLGALQEMTAGYSMDPALHLGVVFPDKCDEMVVVTGIDFTSMCEHHMLTFTGTVAVGYIPDGQVVGLSKLARVVDVFSQRLQVQERMTEQIAHAIETHLEPKGVGVVVRGKHSCMGCRGVRKPGAEMITSALLGYFKDDPKARAEFLGLAQPR